MYISEWEWDDSNEAELTYHGCSRRIVEQVWLERPKYRRNKHHRAASHQMIGPDKGGTIWTICIIQSSFEPGLWRAITGWRATAPDVTWYEQRSRT